MSLITPDNPYICTKVEFALSADRTQPAESWDWTELDTYEAQGRTRPRLVNQTIEITSGRRDESRLADPSQVSFVLGNGDGALAPRNPESPYWPGIVRGTPCRISVQAGLPHLLLTGLSSCRARTPDVAALDITSDLAGAVELLAPVQHPLTSATAYELVGKFNATANQRSWLLFLFDGSLRFRWSTNGTNETTLGSTLPLPSPEAGPITIGWEFDVSNAGNKVLTFYARRGTLADLLANLDDSVLGDPVVSSGTTSINASTAALDIGDINGSGFSPYPGSVRRFQLRAGDLSTGTIVANADFTAQPAGTTSFVDSASRSWSVLGTAEVTDWRPRFCGRVTETAATWDIVDEDNPDVPMIASVDVSASGVLERLNQGDNLQSALTRRLLSPTVIGDVIACWPFEDEREATQVAQLVTGAAPMQIRGDFSFGGDNTYDAALQQMTISDGDNAYMNAPIPAIPQVVGVNWQVTRFFRIDTPTSGTPTQLMAVDSNGEVHTWRITIDDTQVAIAGVDIDEVGVVLDTFPVDDRFFDTEAMIILNVADDGVNVDWSVTLIPIPLGAGFGVSGTYSGNTGIPVRFRNSCTGPPDGISLGHLIISKDRAPGWLAPADSAYINEPAPQRVFRLCRERGISISVDGPYGYDWDAAVTAGAQPMGPQRPLSLLDLIDECAEVDQGLLGELRGSLGLTFRSGVSLRNQPARLTLRRALRQLIEPFDPVDDDLRFANDITVSRPDGSSAHIEDPEIMSGEEERYQQSLDVNVASDPFLPDQAGWRFHLGTWPELRYPQIASDVAKDASLVEDVLGFGVGDRFQVPDPPPGHPPDVIDQLADGITEQLERFQWRFNFIGNPARPWDTATLEDDEQGRLDTAGSELASTFIAGTNTTMTVSTTLGPLWTTSGSEFPFDLEIAGARVRVTGISGSSSPQTFTVSTTIANGVEKSIAAGTTVELWQPAVIAL